MLEVILDRVAMHGFALNVERGKEWQTNQMIPVKMRKINMIFVAGWLGLTDQIGKGAQSRSAIDQQPRVFVSDFPAGGVASIAAGHMMRQSFDKGARADGNLSFF